MLDSYIGQGTVQRSNCYGLLRDDGVTKLIAAIGRKTVDRKTVDRKTVDRKTVDLTGGAVSRRTGHAASGTTG